MKILLVCSAGMSTDILRGEQIKYAKKEQLPLEVKAVGVHAYREYCTGYDVILWDRRSHTAGKRLRRSADICRCLPLRRGTKPREMPHTYWNR